MVPNVAATAAYYCQSQPRAAIVGGSLGGLAAALALHGAGWRNIDVYERSTRPMLHRGSGLGFVHVPAWQALRGDGVPMMRRQEQAHRAQGSFYYGDLWNYLYQGLPEGTVKFGKTIQQVKVNDGNNGEQSSPPTITIEDQAYDLVIFADGGFSKLRNHVLGNEINNNKNKKKNKPNFQQEPEYAGYVVWRGHVSASAVPPSVRQEIQEGVYKQGIYDTIVLKMAKDNGEDMWTMGTFIETPETDVALYWNKATDGASRQHKDETSSVTQPPDWFLNHFQTHFSHVPGLVNLIECMIQHGDITPHPQYEFGAIERIHRGRVLLLGDAAHMASPRTAVGAHTAIMDALALRQAFEESKPNDIDAALALYSRSGIRRAHELYAHSRQVSAQFVSQKREESTLSATASFLNGQLSS